MRKKVISKLLCITIAISMVATALTGCGSEETTATQVQEESKSALAQTETVVAETEQIQETAQTEVLVEEPEEEEDLTLPQVYFASKSGFYEEGFTLELTCPVENAKIYYTMDGTIPDENATFYEGPIALEKKSETDFSLCKRTDFCTDSQYIPEKMNQGHVIRAIAIFEDGTSSVTTCGTYFVGLDREKLYGDSPVISLITDPDNLFNEETGIFILGNSYKKWLAEDPKNAEEPSYRVFGNFANKGKDWERPVSFEMIRANGNNVKADMGLKMKGASTRTYLQKSMKLVAREEYGKKSIKSKLIPGNQKSDGSGEVNKYKTFVLRQGGNDNGFAKLRDPFLQSLVADRNMETQQSIPCPVFVDGEYWGVYALTEDYTDSYIEENYGIDKNNVVIVKCGELEEGNDEDLALFADLYHFITENDMTNADNYAKATELMDMKGFIEYVAFQLYIHNHDTFLTDNNWSFYRAREVDNAIPNADGKWRVLLYDTEFSTGVYTGGSDFGENNISEALKEKNDADVEFKSETPLLPIFRALYKNDTFRMELIRTICDLRNIDFEKTRANAALDVMAEDYLLLAPDSFYRYGPDWVVMFDGPEKYYETKIKELRTYINGRYMAIPNLMEQAFDLDTAVNVSVSSSDVQCGDVALNDTVLGLDTIKSGEFTGSYFTECSLTVEALPKEGHKFIRWEATGATLEDENSEKTNVTFTEKCSIKAIFE